jgi:hypothetical protein
LVVVTRNNFRRVGCEFGKAWKYVFWSVWFEIRDQLVVNGWIRSQDEEIVNPGGQMQVADKSPHQPSLSDRNDRIVVSGGPYIEIPPVDPAFICVPAYDPLVVFFPPRPGIVVGAAISFGFGVTISAAFRPWGWGVCRFDWGAHVLFIHNAPWGRIWANRGVYVHPYGELHRWEPAHRVEATG